ncbi:type II toxin-antitoxin system RelE family toxin [Kyrpidia spormannii]|uniref:type II toxin-antitoxin system RelE family toxin n=1 Tax=Kyrpidia spormannii TaxID=2055160 RepID=UPI0018E47AEB|nr:type II toxin-antitoxin system RelE/ParE family toxin [Kyrpidia spormannii]
MTSGYELLFAKEASKVIRKLDKVTAKRILQAIESLSVNPCHHPKTKPMKGYEGQFYRLKVGNWVHGPFRKIGELPNVDSVARGDG